MTILVIEDDPRIYELYRSHLEAKGHDVDVAADYNTAVSRRHQVEDYDLNISDVDFDKSDLLGLFSHVDALAAHF